VPPGTSVHIFSPRPSDIEHLENAKGIVYVSDNLDGWVAHAQTESKFKIFDYIPDSNIIHAGHGHTHGHEDETGIDPHFWTDPVLVGSIIPKLTAWMISLNPIDSAKYFENSKKLIEKLEQMHLEFQEKFKEYKGKPVILYHPAFLYFLKRYGLEYAGSIEESPGKEPSFRQLADLRNKVKQLNIKIIYGEPQMPEKTLQVVADGLDVLVLFLDPVGGGDPGRDDYFELMRFNAKNLLKSFK